MLFLGMTVVLGFDWTAKAQVATTPFGEKPGQNLPNSASQKPCSLNLTRSVPKTPTSETLEWPGNSPERKKRDPININVYVPFEPFLAEKMTDTDCDGISDYDDNCRVYYNPLQEDKNKNGFGDVCESVKSLNARRPQRRIKRTRLK